MEPVRARALELLIATLDEMLEPSEICLSSVFHTLRGNQVHIRAPELAKYARMEGQKQALYTIMAKHDIVADVSWTTWVSIGVTCEEAMHLCLELGNIWGMNFYTTSFQDSLDMHKSTTEGQILPELYTTDFYAFPLHVYAVPEITLS